MSNRRAALARELRGHQPADDAEARDLGRIQAFLATDEDHFSRHNPGRHVTASALVASPERDRILLMHHRKLDMWLQFGGHVEPADPSVPAAALREVGEESGLADVTLVAEPAPLDVDIHTIPARGDEPEHEHFDVRYLAIAPVDGALDLDRGEVNELRWFAIDAVRDLELDPGLVRAIGKVTGPR